MSVRARELLALRAAAGALLHTARTDVLGAATERHHERRERRAEGKRGENEPDDQHEPSKDGQGATMRLKQKTRAV